MAGFWSSSAGKLRGDKKHKEPKLKQKDSVATAKKQQQQQQQQKPVEFVIKAAKEPMSVQVAADISTEQIHEIPAAPAAAPAAPAAPAAVTPAVVPTVAQAAPVAPVSQAPVVKPPPPKADISEDLMSGLLTRNHEWASETAQTNPGLFPAMSRGQSPQVLWVGCSDSRVPETTVLNLQPGEVFVHRNIANILPATDLSSLSVLQYAVEVLQVQHIIVCGHYGCGGVNAALAHKRLGLIDSWLRGVREVRAKHEKHLVGLTPKEQSNKLVELNVMEQVRSVLKNANVQEAMEERGLEVHGWVFDINCGECHVLECPEDPEAHVFTVKDPRKLL